MSFDDRPVYTPVQVERLLKNYLAIRSVLLGSTRQPADRVFYVDTPQDAERFERPFGFDGKPWPMNEPQHARKTVDGKAKARAATELHVSVIDLENGMRRLPDDDLELVYKYYLFQTHTLEELCAERSIPSPETMRRRLKRVLRRLTEVMLNEPCP